MPGQAEMGRRGSQTLPCKWGVTARFEAVEGRVRFVDEESWVAEGTGMGSWCSISAQGKEPGSRWAGTEACSQGSRGSLMTSLASGPQEACERSLAEMESSHQQVMEQLQRHHERELQRLQQEKEWLLAEETAATASGEEQGCALGRPGASTLNWEAP